MITSCSHTFCSLCIRRALSNDNKCPLCRAVEQEVKLRSNWSMEEAVEAFKKARPVVLELARKVTAVRSPKRKAGEDDDLQVQGAPESKRLRSSARLNQRGSQSAPSYVPEPVEGVIEVSDVDDDYVPEPGKCHLCSKPDLSNHSHVADGLVPCPMCKSRMKEWQVFAHIETCTGEKTKAPTPNSKAPSNSISPFLGGQGRNKDAVKLERLPALNYSIIGAHALRKKMSEMGISTNGSILACQKRHKEYVTIWNANCDAANPKKRHELIADLDLWERTGSRSVPNAAVIKDKDFDGDAWARKNNTSFKDLIASAKRSSAEAKKKLKEEDNPTESSKEAKEKGWKPPFDDATLSFPEEGFTIINEEDGMPRLYTKNTDPPINIHDRRVYDRCIIDYNGSRSKGSDVSSGYRSYHFPDAGIWITGKEDGVPVFYNKDSKPPTNSHEKKEYDDHVGLFNKKLTRDLYMRPKTETVQQTILNSSETSLSSTPITTPNDKAQARVDMPGHSNQQSSQQHSHQQQPSLPAMAPAHQNLPSLSSVGIHAGKNALMPDRQSCNFYNPPSPMNPYGSSPYTAPSCSLLPNNMHPQPGTSFSSSFPPPKHSSQQSYQHPNSSFSSHRPPPNPPYSAPPAQTQRPPPHRPTPATNPSSESPKTAQTACLKSPISNTQAFESYVQSTVEEEVRAQKRLEARYEREARGAHQLERVQRGRRARELAPGQGIVPPEMMDEVLKRFEK